MLLSSKTDREEALTNTIRQLFGSAVRIGQLQHKRSYEHLLPKLAFSDELLALCLELMLFDRKSCFKELAVSIAPECLKSKTQLETSTQPTDKTQPLLAVGLPAQSPVLPYNQHF